MTAPLRMHLLRAGVMECDLTWLLLKGGVTLADRYHSHDHVPWGRCPTYAVLIEGEEGRLLWDSGVPRDWESRWAPTGLHDFFPVVEHSLGHQYLDESLDALDLTPDDIDILVLSHLHFDHAGNARMFDNGKTRIMASADEIAGVATIEGDWDGPYLLADFEGLKLEPVIGDTEIMPGVTALQTPGHTWGTMSLQVDLPSGTRIFTSDSVYMQDSYGPPACGSVRVWNERRWQESVEKIRDIEGRTGAELIFGHDSEQFDRLGFAPERYYQ